MYLSPLVLARASYYKALALSSLVLATMLLSCASAFAGSWIFTCTGSGTNTDTHPPVTYASPQIDYWFPPGPQTGSFSLGTFGGGNDYSSSDVATISVTVKATWQPDANLPADPAPPNVWLCESSQSQWTQGSSGSADDGFGDAAVPNYFFPNGGYGALSSTSPGTTHPPAHWTNCTVSGGTVTLPERTLTGEGDFAPTTSSPYGDNCYASVGNYTVTVHAQPYGWYDAGYNDPDGTHHTGPNISGGVMTFVWGWKSTSGSLADLAGITMYETVDYSGNPGTFSADNKLFYPQSPPVQAGYHVPNGRAGSTIDPTVLYARDAHSPFPVMSTAAITFTVPQQYKFDDQATKDIGTVLYDCGSIVEGNFLDPFRWDITELGSIAHTYYN